jgi:hypothetical protein
MVPFSLKNRHAEPDGKLFYNGRSQAVCLPAEFRSIIEE